jgi:hypothetical protein
VWTKRWKTPSRGEDASEHILIGWEEVAHMCRHHLLWRATPWGACQGASLRALSLSSIREGLWHREANMWHCGTFLPKHAREFVSFHMAWLANMERWHSGWHFGNHLPYHNNQMYGTIRGREAVKKGRKGKRR